MIILKVRTSQEDAEVSDLLRTFDKTVARLFEMGVSPYHRCVWAIERAPVIWEKVTEDQL